MCAIVGSSNADILKEFIRLNSYRGSHSYSISLFNKTTGILSVLEKRLGKPNLDNLTIPANSYAIVHIQAPTTDGKTREFIHPATLVGKFESWPEQALWHNGIIKDEVVKENISKWNTSWDTMQILKCLHDSDNRWTELNEFDGTFSCLYYDRANLSLYIFRNEISPMFVDDNLNLSSTKFEGSRETEPNKVFKINFSTNSFTEVGKFTTVENPYYFME